MYPDCASLAPLYEVLCRIDCELAERTREEGCPHCGGPLDYGRWQRKPRGVDMPDEVCVRHGLCCRQECCRERKLAPSTLFMDRRVYWAAVMLIVVVVRQRRLEGQSARALRRRFGVTPRTLRRWITWYETAFARTHRWKMLRSLVPCTIRDADLPSSLLAVFDLREGPGAQFARGSPAPQKLRGLVS